MFVSSIVTKSVGIKGTARHKISPDKNGRKSENGKRERRDARVEECCVFGCCCRASTSTFDDESPKKKKKSRAREWSRKTSMRLLVEKEAVNFLRGKFGGFSV